MKTPSKNKTRITQIKEELFESEELYRLLFNNGNDAAFVSLRHAGEKLRGRFILVNNIACQRLGYTREELLQMGPLDISVSLPTINGTMEKLAIDKTVIYEEIHITKDGREIPVEISTRSFELNGKQVNLSTARDITERKQAEEELRLQSAALNAAANAMLSPTAMERFNGLIRLGLS
jgi:PAS domain S-box-containing protein